MRRTILITIIFTMLTACLFAGETPKKNRNYILVFDVIEYSAQVKEAVNYFFNKLLLPGDQLIIVTPSRYIGFSSEKLKTPKNKLLPPLLDQLKKDISMGSVNYRTTMQEMLRLVQGLSGASSSSGLSTKEVLINYSQQRNSLSALRQNMKKKLTGYIDIFRSVKGENHVLMFFEKEFRPVPDKKIMGRLRESPAISFTAAEAFIEEHYKSGIDPKQLAAGYTSANIRFHFLYLQGKGAKTRRGVDYLENSGELYDIFTELAKATGGINTTSSKTSAFLKEVRDVIKGKVEVEVISETGN